MNTIYVDDVQLSHIFPSIYPMDWYANEDIPYLNNFVDDLVWYFHLIRLHIHYPVYEPKDVMDHHNRHYVVGCLYHMLLSTSQIRNKTIDYISFIQKKESI